MLAKKMSIRTHLWILVLVAAIPLGAMVAVNIYNETDQSIEFTKKILNAHISTIVHNTGNKISVIRQKLEYLANHPALKYLDPKKCDNSLSDIKYANIDYSNIVSTDLMGKAICTAVPFPDGKAITVSEFDWFQDFLKKKSFAISRPHIGPITGKWVAVLSQPIWNDKKEMVGAIHISLDLKAYDPVIPDNSFSEESRYGFFNYDGYMIWRNKDPEGIIGTRPNADAARTIVKVKNGDFESVAVDGVSRYFMVRSMPEIGWVAFVGVPSTEVYTSAKERAIILSVMALLVIIVLLMIAFIIARRISIPVFALEKNVQAIREGGTGVRAQLDGPREIVAVAEAFNKMVSLQEKNENELRLANQEMKSAKEKAEESDRLKSAFLSNMSHEIRTPMNSIIGFSEMLSSDSLPENERIKYSAIINKSCHRLLNTINDILDLSRLDAGQGVIKSESFSIKKMLNELFTTHCDLFSKKGIVLQLSMEFEMNSLVVIGDDQKIYQVLNNLLTNAFKFTKVGKVEFGCRAVHNDLEFFVSDSGVGIAKEKQELIFGRFYQEDVSITRDHEGSGLGLAISKGLVTLLGGKIWFESRKGTGSTFKFTVPLIIERTVMNEELTNPQISLHVLEKNLENKCVLVAEDEPSSYFLLQTILVKYAKMKVLHAENGHEAINLLKKNSEINLVIMDLKMPVMDGLVATQKIREFNRQIPIIAVTAYASAEDEARALQAGCSAYVSKPFEVKTILQKVTEALVLNKRV